MTLVLSSLYSYKYTVRLLITHCLYTLQALFSFASENRKMAVSVSSALPPVRSISLPTRLNPTSLTIQEELNKLRMWQSSAAISVAQPLGAETIRVGLLGLAKLYNCIDGLIQSPVSAHALLRHQGGDVADKALDESVLLLDVCSLGRDLVCTVTEQVQVLQSALRRKGVESSIQSHLGAYLSFRKKARKDISKSIKALKQTENNTSTSSVGDQNYLVQVLREVRNITISVLQSLLSFLSSPALKNKLGGYSLMSRIMPTGFLSSEKVKEMNEIENVDLALYNLNLQVRNKEFKSEVTAVQRKLEALTPCMEGLEAGLDCMYKCLIRYRVSLLNVLNQ